MKLCMEENRRQWAICNLNSMVWLIHLSIISQTILTFSMNGYTHCVILWRSTKFKQLRKDFSDIVQRFHHYVRSMRVILFIVTFPPKWLSLDTICYPKSWKYLMLDCYISSQSMISSYTSWLLSMVR